MKKVLKKLLVCICLFIILFNFTMIESNYVYAAYSEGDFESNASNLFSGTDNEVIETIASTLSGIVGLLTWVMRLPFAVTPLIIQTVGGAIAKMDNVVSPSDDFIFLTPYHIIFNKIHLTSINFFDLSTPATGATHTIRVEIAKWYYVMRIIAISILLGILIFVGIKMAISTVATEKAIYKKALVDWVTSLALVFLLHYIIRAVLWINTGLVEIFAGSNENLDKLFEDLGKAMFKIDFLTAVTAIIVYMMITVQTLMFLISYIKRMITLAFLIIISPLITITYSIDKMGDQKAQALNTWLKEFSYNVLIQPFHCILFLVFVSTALKLITDSGKSVAASVLAILCIKFVWDGEKIVRKIFGFEQASSLAAAAASGAVIGNMIGKAQNIGKGAASGIKFAKNSKLGQAAKNSKIGQKISQKRETKKTEKYQKKAMKDLGLSGSNFEELGAHDQQRVTNRAQERRTISNTRKEKAKTFARKVGKSKAIRAYAGAISAVTVASAMYAMPDSNLVTSIGGGYAAGKSASSGVKKLQENKKEHFEENIVKAWNNHCNITGNDKNSKEEFNKWYENTYTKGKQMDEYSQKNMGKAEGAARKDLQEAGIKKEDLDSIISQLQRAILTKEPYDPAKLFTGYTDANNKPIEAATIAAVIAPYAAKYNESYAYKNVSDYNEQMGQFGVTAEDAVNGISDTEFESHLTPQVESFVQPETPEEVIETSTNTSEVLENEKLELVSEELSTVYNDNGGESADLENVADMLQNIVSVKVANIEEQLRSNVSGMEESIRSQMEQVMNDIIGQVINMKPENGNLESQISNIVSGAMKTLKLDGDTPSINPSITPEQSVEIQNNLRNYTTQQIVNNYVSNNYSNTTTTAGFNPEKLKSDLEKIANKNK